MPLKRNLHWQLADGCGVDFGGSFVLSAGARVAAGNTLDPSGVPLRLEPKDDLAVLKKPGGIQAYFSYILQDFFPKQLACRGSGG